MSERDFKALPFTNIKSKSTGRTRTGIAAVFGNIDAVGDRIMPGAFARTIPSNRAKHLWNHSYQHPPTAAIKELRELTRDELPAEVLAKAPEATGGLLVTREYFNNDLSNWILEAIDADQVDEMSFAYDTVKSATVTEPTGDGEKTREIRELHELKLFDTSDVLWGCNAATVAAGAKNIQLLPLGAVVSQFLMLSEQLKAEAKAGRRNSDSDQKLVDIIHNTAISLGAKCAPEEDGKSGNPAESKSNPSENESEKPGPGGDATPLSFDQLKLTLFEIENLTV